MDASERRARGVALLLPLALLAGALGSQYLGGLHPCEMCHWQRWPHYGAVAVAAAAFVVPGRATRRGLVVAAALLIGASGLIGLFHAGVEYHWWRGITACSRVAAPAGATPADQLRAILNAPIVRCDAAQWTMAGVSLAGYNAILSLGGAGVVLALMRPRRRDGMRRTA